MKLTRKLELLVFCAFILIMNMVDAGDLPNGDFEIGGYSGWTTSGTAWGICPVNTGRNYQHFYYAADTLGQGESATGTLTSPTFVLTKLGVRFMIAGNNYVVLKRASDDAELARVWGPNLNYFVKRTLSSQANVGKEVYVQAVDEGNGWIAVDNFWWWPHITCSFEMEGFAGWTETGNAFGGKASSTLHDSMSGQQGNYWADSVVGGETATGTLKSDVFPFAAAGVSFLIAGYNHWPGQEDPNQHNYVSLHRAVDGEEIWRAWAPDSNSFVRVSYNGAGHVGEGVYLQIVDNGNLGEYSWIAVDDIRVAEQQSKDRLVGMYYLTWFNNDNISVDHEGSGWIDNPFNLDDVKSLSFWDYSDGYCYSSQDQYTAEVHAKHFDNLNVDFVIFDDTNYGKVMYPASNPIFQGAVKALEGFRNRTFTEKQIKCAWQLSIVCWAQQCWGIPGDYREILTYNQYVKAHAEAIAELAIQYPDSFVMIDGKPLLLFYVNAGNNVYDLNTGELAFNGPGNYVPTEADFNPTLNLSSGNIAIRDFFSVRFAVFAVSSINYSNYSDLIWPFTCHNKDTNFTEVGFTAVYYPITGKRSISDFEHEYNEAISLGKDFIFFRSWSEFSSTDEHYGQAWTLEPNTQLYKYDTTPDNNDPWYFYNGVKEILNPMGRIKNSGFESGNFSEWNWSGLAFGRGPVSSGGNTSGNEGNYWADSLKNGEEEVAVLRSDNFRLNGDVTFLIAGYNHYPNVQPPFSHNYVTLNLADGTEIYRVWAPGQDAFTSAVLIAGGYVDQEVYIEIVDDGSLDDYSWIAVDNFQFIERPANPDYLINFIDYAELSKNWGWTGEAGGNLYDLDNSGAVDFADLKVIAARWLESSL